MLRDIIRIAILLAIVAGLGALKLTNYIDWSWWWVISPLWITGAVFVSIILGALIFAAVES